MTLKIQWLLNIVMILLSWLTMPLLGWRTIRSFLPASILSIVICSLDAQIGKKRKWWSFYNKPQSFIQNEFPFLIGPMLAMSLWTLKWSYGNFKKFIILNAIGEAIFVSPITRVFTKLKLYRLVKFNEFQFFLYFFYKAFFLYGFQYLFEKGKKLNKGN
ncbi:hypothetical protein PH210_22500 [Paenibacillus sp. BSR1-1]|uniref:hypothetical protein n=1 Tax=Paenibacillus sp. BSR1-1 TaxID=3020845 RepID=UPI0025B214C3|nr:hypothetical protein [Paenibacillus sp. BSR1-1]MDN3018946.1 hypothetical protein [Paenibacillus sp. BSR1-1]